ncbi:SURF1 family protein [Caulobacter hibisci]|uniref:SURF1-like protein n=1 Tax=Caulobacter hibisci TaxID=2035993 RepID=A0ABS0T122_9CAUL|nr:SURF1 family cytochrome oxidase biogenesis protein [Caulobacter hibisci]MBI1684810.1 SURF1 family protein [Caulobacter hibisci]
MSEVAPRKPGFPIGLTIATLIAFAILCGLGSWQVKRLHWKEDLLARIETLKTASAIPLADALTRADKGEDVGFMRVAADCAPETAAPLPLVYGVRDGDIVWRAVTPCRLAGQAHGVVLLDLGVVDALKGQMAPPPRAFAAPARVVGVLMVPKTLGGDRDKALTALAADKPAPYILMVETATPAVAGVTPAPLPAEISNRHLEYALTWFGLAVTLLFIYAAMLWRRMRP